MPSQPSVPGNWFTRWWRTEFRKMTDERHPVFVKAMVVFLIVNLVWTVWRAVSARTTAGMVTQWVFAVCGVIGLVTWAVAWRVIERRRLAAEILATRQRAPVPAGLPPRARIADAPSD